MSDFLNAVISGIGFGSLYGLVALGLVVVFKSTGILNFSAGALMAVGGLVAASVGQGFWVSALIAIVVVGAIGGTANLVVMRPLLGRGLFPGVMVTIGLASILQGVSGIAFGHQASFLDAPIEQASFQLPLDTSMSSTLLVSLVLSVTATVALSIAFRRTPVGLQLRAAASRPEVAAAFGANPTWIFTYAWVVAGALAALAGATPLTPASASASSLFSAPRSLNDAVNCRFSNFRKTWVPRICPSVFDSTHGVSSTWPASRSAAASMSASVTGAAAAVRRCPRP